MLGDIDYNLKPIKPKIFLTKPNREIIAKVSEGYDINRSTSLSELFTLSFKIPFYIEENNQPIRNRNVDIIRERYHIKAVIGNKVEWYIITKIRDVMGNKGDSKEIDCIYLPQELNDKLIGGYTEESKDAREVLNDILSSQVNWSIGYMDADFELSKRLWEFSDDTLLSAIYKVMERYNAIIEWNTENRTFDMIKPELHGINRLGTFSIHKYLKSIDRESNAETVVTRLRPTGNDGLTIQRVNPSGSPYIEDFSYWMYPFERDVNKNVITQSYFMSDSLCNALLDHKELSELYSGQFTALNSQIDVFDTDYRQKREELNALKNQLAKITQIQLAQQFDGVMFFDKYDFNGTAYTSSFPLDNTYLYAVLIKVGNAIGNTATVNGQTATVQSDSWVLTRKFNAGTNNIDVRVSGSNPTDIFIQVVHINQEEYDTVGNGSLIVDKYNFDNKEMEIAAKEAEMVLINADIMGLNQQIANIRSILSTANNFTQAQIEELDGYSYQQNYSDDTITDDEDLFEEAQKRFDEYKIPQLNLKIDIVNFMEIIEEQRNWNQLYLGDKVIVKYDVFDLKVEAKIIEIDYDYESSNISLTIANFKDLTTGKEQLDKFLYESKGTTSIVNDNKSKWNQALVDTSEFSQIFENFWDKTTNQINMALNQHVTMDDRGITIIDHNDPSRFLRMTNGVVGLTRSNGERYETAISADGLIAEVVMGKLLLGSRITIGTEDGIWMTEGSQTTITDRCGRVAMKLGLYEENPDLYGMVINRYDNSVPCSPDIINKVIANSERGFLIQKANGAVFEDVAYLDTDGLLNIRKLQIDYIAGVLSNNVNISAEDGIVATRSDIMTRSLMSGVRGFAIQENTRTPENPQWVDRFSVNPAGQVVAQSILIKDSFITEGGIEGAYIILRDGSGGVMKLYPSEGLWAGSEDAADSMAWIKPDGTATFRKLVVTNGTNGIMIDSEKNFIDFSTFDILAGYLEAENIKTDIITANYGVISDILTSRLITKDAVDPTGNIINYIKVEGNTHQWITATADGTMIQAKNFDGALLYYLFGTTDQLTTSTLDLQGNPNTPVMVKNYGQERVKMDFSFYGSQEAAYPVIQMGQGDGELEDSGKAYIRKPNTMWEFIYKNSNYAQERRVVFRDDSLEISTQTGFIQISHDNGTFIKLNSNGSIDINATSQINITGTQYNFM